MNLVTKLKKVGIGHVRHELEMLWSNEALTSSSVIRAATYNLIIFTSDELSAEQTSARIIELTRERPGRVIVIDVEPGSKDAVDAWIAVYCQNGGEHQVCGELITLGVHGSLREEIHSNVLALLSPDIPVYLWWTGELQIDDHLFMELMDVADRVIVDSNAFDDCTHGLNALAQINDVVPTSDLTWARFGSWRQVLAYLWDIPALQTPLAQIRILEIEHQSSGVQKDSEIALLLVGWLADRLSWTLRDGVSDMQGGYRTSWQKGDWSGKVMITESHLAEIPPSSITEIRIRAGAEDQSLEIHLTARPEIPGVEILVTGGSSEPIRMTRRLNPMQTSEALAEELDLGFDPLYQSALNNAVHIIATCTHSEATTH